MSRIPGTTPLEIPGTEPLGSGIPGTITLSPSLGSPPDQDVWREIPQRGFAENWWEHVKQSSYDALPVLFREAIFGKDSLRALPQIQQGGTSGFTGDVVGGLAGILNPANAAETGLSFAIGGPGSLTVAKPLGRAVAARVGQRAGRVAAGAARNAVINAEQGAAFSALQRAGQIGPEGFTEDPFGALSQVAGAGAVGAGAGIAGGAIAHPLFAFPGVVGEARQKAQVAKLKTDLVREKVLTKQEALDLGTNKDAVVAVALARHEGHQVRIEPVLEGGKPKLDELGRPEVKITTKPDTVTWQEKQALGQNPDLIDPYRESLAKGGDRLSIDPSARDPVPKFFFPLKKAQEAGYLRDATELTDRVTTQEKIAKLQRSSMAKLQVLRKDVRLPAEERFALARVLDEEYTERVGLLLQKDNDSTRGARRKVTKAVAESEIPDKPSVLTKLDEAFRAVESRSKNDTQRGSVERLLEEISNPKYGFDDSVIKTVEDLHRRLFTSEDLLPFSEKARRGLDQGREFVRAAQTFPEREARAKVAELIKTLPPDKVKEFTDRALNAKGKIELKSIAQDIVNSQEKFLRAATFEKVRDLVRSVEKNPKRDEIRTLLDEARPEPEIETVGPAAIKYKDQVYPGEVKDGMEESHANVFLRIKDTLPEKDRVDFSSQFIDDKLSGYTTSKGRFVGRAEGAKVSAQAKTPREKASLFVQEGGVEALDPRALRKMLDQLTPEQGLDLKSQIARLVRKGQIEKGLYNRAQGFSTKKVLAETKTWLEKRKDRSERRQQKSLIRTGAAAIADPVSFWGWLDQVSGGDPDAPLNKYLHKDLVKGYSQHLRNRASTQSFVNDKAKEVYGLDLTKIGQFGKLMNHMREKLPSGIKRSDAMIAYALSTDSGRREPLSESGISDKRKDYVANDVIAELSTKDKEFVDKTKTFLKGQGFIEKAFSQFLASEGYEPARSEQWFTSKRVSEKEELQPDFASFVTSVGDSIDALKARVKDADKPFDVSEGYLSAFFRVTDELSLYGELGKSLHKAQTILSDTETKKLFKQKFGEDRRDQLELYLKNIYGHVGHRPTGLDKLTDTLVSNAAVSKVALNVGSAAKQSLDTLILYADGTLDPKAINKAVKEGAWFSKKVDKRMTDESGAAYLRYNGDRFLQNLLVSGQEGKSSTLSRVQHRTLVLQRFLDRRNLRIAWRSAEIMAEQRGLKGREAQEFVRDNFELAIHRAQPTDNPLYASGLEVEAKRSKVLRGTMLFLRQPNRIYNIARHRVVRAVQEPTSANISQAAKSLLYGVIGNTLGIVSIDQLRRAAFGQPVTQDSAQRDAMQNLVGLWYLASNASTLVDGMIDKKDRHTDRVAGPLSELAVDLFKTGWNLTDAATADPEETVKSGVNRGELKRDEALLKAADSGTSLLGGVLGMPFWAIWHQGTGLYRWNRTDLILMTELEQERAQLRSDGEEGSARWEELERATAQVNKIHQLREKGLLDKDDAREQIREELEQVLR